MDEARRRRYALAGAMAVAVADLLREAHTALADVDDAAAVAAGARVHSAAAACSAVTARLLILERDAVRLELGIADVPQRPEFAVTILEGLPRSTWSATVRAVAAAGTELVSARAAWERLGGDGDAVHAVAESLRALLGYVESLAGLLEAEAPKDIGGV